MKSGRISSYCVDCIMEKQERNISLVADGDARKRYRQEVVQDVEGRSEEESVPALTAKLSLLQEKYLGDTNVFGEIKEKYNRIMLNLEPELWQEIENSEDSLARALSYARAGNFIDFGAMREVDDSIMMELIAMAPEVRLPADVYRDFLGDLENAERLVYLVDNCGEIVLDKLLIRAIHQTYPEIDITVIVRGAPVLNDATMEDAKSVGLTDMEGIRVITNGNRVAGTELRMLSGEASDAMYGADVIISKGQGNFETLHGCGMNIYYLFLCKCDWFSMNLGLPKLGGVFENEKVLTVRWNAETA